MRKELKLLRGEKQTLTERTQALTNANEALRREISSMIAAKIMHDRKIQQLEEQNERFLQILERRTPQPLSVPTDRIVGNDLSEPVQPVSAKKRRRKA